jgi:hypothetical protein
MYAPAELLPLAMQTRSLTASVAPKAQHEPQNPWSRTGPVQCMRAVSLRGSYASGVALISSIVWTTGGMAATPSARALRPSRMVAIETPTKRSLIPAVHVEVASLLTRAMSASVCTRPDDDSRVVTIFAVAPRLPAGYVQIPSPWIDWQLAPAGHAASSPGVQISAHCVGFEEP